MPKGRPRKNLNEAIENIKDKPIKNMSDELKQQLINTVEEVVNETIESKLERFRDDLDKVTTPPKTLSELHFVIDLLKKIINIDDIEVKITSIKYGLGSKPFSNYQFEYLIRIGNIIEIKVNKIEWRPTIKDIIQFLLK